MHKTILIVDDDEAMADNLEDILEDEGYRLITANTCADALARAKENNPHVALLDLKLPDDTGINLLADLKFTNPDCVCALMTAFADVDSAITALEKGAFHYLQKPVRPIELINLLERIFETIQIREDKRIAEERLKESERRFRTIFESAQDAIFLKDTSLKYTLVNPSMERLYDLKAGEFMGETDETLFGSEKGAQSRTIEERVLQGEIVEEELKIERKGTKIFHSIKVPLTGKTGKTSGICGFTRDITATKALEAQLLQAQKMEAIGTLAGGISHDFNNLLQAILGYSQMLLMEKTASSPETAKLREIEKAAQRATELTSQLLAFSRKVEIHPRPVNLNQVVRQVEKLLERTIPKMINIELRLTEPVLTVNADPGQVEQVLLNIGVNARDAMPDGGRLIIETANIGPDAALRKLQLGDVADEYVRLSIADNGQGMSDEIREHIFEPFYTTKQPGKGTGLGLAMAYGIIHNHGGQILCESQAGKGTVFKIYLPAIKMAAAKRIIPPEEQIKKGGGETILVIDDEEFLRELAKDMLTKNGYQVITAGSGETGLSLYRKNSSEISLIILDLIMPGMGGKHCLKKILDFNPKANVVISSGYSMENPASDDVLQKARGFIQKPYNFRKMLKLLHDVINE